LSTKSPRYSIAAVGVWFVLVFGPGRPVARHNDRGVAIFEAAGFTGEQADKAAAIVFTYGRGSAPGQPRPNR
jgi:hypothetical protein